MEQIPVVTLLSNGVKVDGKVIDDYSLFDLKLTPDTPNNLISSIVLNGVVLPDRTVTDLLAEGMNLRDVVRQCVMYSNCEGEKAYKATFHIVSHHPVDGFPATEEIEYNIPLETKLVQGCKKEGNLLFSRYPLGASESGALVDEGVVTMPNDLPRFKYRLTKTANIIGLGVQVYDDSATFDPNLDWKLEVPPEKQDFGLEVFCLEGHPERTFLEVVSNAPFEVALASGTAKSVRTIPRMHPSASYSVIVSAHDAGLNTEYRKDSYSNSSSVKYAEGSVVVIKASGSTTTLAVSDPIHIRKPYFSTSVVVVSSEEGGAKQPYIKVSGDLPFALATSEGYVQAKPNGGYPYSATVKPDVLSVERRQVGNNPAYFVGEVSALVLGKFTLRFSVNGSAPKENKATQPPVVSEQRSVTHKVAVDSKGTLLDLGLLEANYLATGNDLYLTKTFNGVLHKARVVRRVRMGTVWGYCQSSLGEGYYGVMIDGVSGDNGGTTHVVEVATSDLSQYPNPSIFFEEPQTTVYATQIEGVNAMFKGTNTIYIRSDAPVEYELEISNEIIGGSTFGTAGLNVTKIEFDTEDMKNVKLRVMKGKYTTPDEKDDGITFQTHIWSVVDAEKETAIITDADDISATATFLGKQFPVLFGKAQIPVKNAAAEAGLTLHPNSIENLRGIVSVNAVRIEKDDEIEPTKYLFKKVQGVGTDKNGSYNVVLTCAEAGALSEVPLPDIIVRSDSKWEKSVEAGQGVTVHHVVDGSITIYGYDPLKVDVLENTAVTKSGIEEGVTHEYMEQYGVYVFTLPDGCVPVKVPELAAIIEGKVYSELENCLCIVLCDGKLLDAYLSTNNKLEA